MLAWRLPSNEKSTLQSYSATLHSWEIHKYSIKMLKMNVVNKNDTWIYEDIHKGKGTRIERSTHQPRNPRVNEADGTRNGIPWSSMKFLYQVPLKKKTDYD